ncbi:MAG: acetate/propionate family kinase [Steroidobacteraceae bacterium]
MSPAGVVLTLNAGSSSIRFAAFEARQPARRLWWGKLDRPGTHRAHLSVHGLKDADALAPVFGESAALDTAARLVRWLYDREPQWLAVGHRVVHGLSAAGPRRIDEALLESLRALVPFDPEHLPQELMLIDEARAARPGVAQWACFDTSFHHDMPAVAQRLPIPRRFFDLGVRRYGFHGLSYQHLVEELHHIGDPAASSGRVVLAHLGNGASVAAVLDGRSIDTSMALTPTAGLIMGSRSGDLDPGLAGYLARTQGMSLEQFSTMVNRESGLLGISGISSDMRELLARESREPAAAEAIEAFCYQARKWIASMTAALGGIDLLVFSGGIGENLAVIRERICNGLGFLGVGVDSALNAARAPIISPPEADVRVRVIAADEELMIANAVVRSLS